MLSHIFGELRRLLAWFKEQDVVNTERFELRLQVPAGSRRDHSRLPASLHLQPPKRLQYQGEGGSGKIYEESLYKEDNFYNEGYLFRQEK